MLEPSAISHTARISACEKGKQWQRVSRRCSASCGGEEVEPGVVSYSAGIRDCENGEQWQPALALLSELRRRHAGVQRHQTHSWDEDLQVSCRSGLRRCSASCGGDMPVPSVWDLSAGISACETGEQWQRVLAPLSEQRRREAGDHRHELQRGDQRLRDRPALAAGSGVAQRAAAGTCWSPAS